MKRFHSKWFKICNDESEREELQELLSNNSVIVTKLKEIIESELSASQVSVRSDYDKPSWAYYQAHKNGEIDMLNKILNILTPKE